MTVSIDEIERASFFEELAPSLSISSSVAPPNLTLDEIPAWSSGGYARLPRVVAPELVEPMANAVTTLVRRGLHPIFAYVYDAFWQPAALLHPFATSVLGPCDLVRDGWAWLIPAGPGHGGWSPHRDWRNADHELITVWIALTEANEDNSCIFLVPRDRDPACLSGNLEDDSVSPNEAVSLPAVAGTALSWSQHVLHWGSPSTERARHPRISFSYSFAAKHTPGRTAIDLGRFDFKDRLDTIAQMITTYTHQERMPPPLDGWAEMLFKLRSARGASAWLRKKGPRKELG